MALATLQSLSIGYRGPLLLDNVNCQIEAGQRIGLVGRNGTGKTTHMRLLSGETLPDHGTVEIANDSQVAWLPQDVPRDLKGTVQELVMQGLPIGWRDSETPWVYEQRVEKILDQMELSPDRLIETESSGRKRRVLLARALASDPQLLLLDESTNHLDLPSIQWLEEFLQHRWTGTMLFVTHDRIELDSLPAKIELLEASVAKIHRMMATPNFYQQDRVQILAVQNGLKKVDQELANTYLRWEELDNLDCSS